MSESTSKVGIDLHSFLGFSPQSARLAALLAQVPSELDVSQLTPEVKVYSDGAYFNYHSLGITLLFHPTKGYKLKTGLPRTELDESKLMLASIDIYNHEGSLDDPTAGGKRKPAKPSPSKPTFSPFPAYPIRVSYSSDPNADSANPSPTPLSTFLIDPSTTGKDFMILGEPDRKGGGEGSMGIWTEWTSLGLMVEFASGGLQAWDKGGAAVWKVATIFERGVIAGKDDGE